MATTNQQVYNCDVDGLARRINRNIVEIIKSQSGGVSLTVSFDVVRWGSYLNAVEAYLDYVVSQPQIDLPETHPLPVTLLPAPTIPMMENESAYDLAQLFDTMREEVVNSQSARMPSGLISHDELRLRSYISRGKKFLTDYITLVDPLDLPESSPMAPMTGAGQKGV